MTEQAREKADHGTRHAGHFDEKAEEHEQRHGQQDDVAHAFIHPADHNQRRQVAS